MSSSRVPYRVSSYKDGIGTNYDRSGHVARERNPVRGGERRRSRSRERYRSSSRRGHDDMQVCDGSSDEEAAERRRRDPMDYAGSAAVDDPEFVPGPAHDVIRDGLLFEHPNYWNFMTKWISAVNDHIKVSKMTLPEKKIKESISSATPEEKLRINLPLEVKSRGVLLHCDMTISGLPPSVFFGSGFGENTRLAKCAAAKDLVDKCHRVGLVSSKLHTSVGMQPFLDKNRQLPDFSNAVRAMVSLDLKLSIEHWPWDVLQARVLDPSTAQRLKLVFSSVMEEIYFSKTAQPAFDDPFSNAYMNMLNKFNQPTATQLADSEASSFFPARPPKTTRPSVPLPIVTVPPPLGFPRPKGKGFDVSAADIERKLRIQREELQAKARQHAVEPLNDDGWDPVGLGPGVAASMAPSAMPGMPPPGFDPILAITPGAAAMGIPPPFPGAPFLPPHGFPGPSVTRHAADPPQVQFNPILAQRQLAEVKAKKLEEEKRKKAEEELLRLKEAEMKRKLERELEEKKKQMEEEMRKKIIEEERAKLLAEMRLKEEQEKLERAKAEQAAWRQSAAMGYPSTSSHPSDYRVDNVVVGSSTSTTYGEPHSSTDNEIEEINRLVRDIEGRLTELQRNAQTETLNVIFQSATFQKLSWLGNNIHEMDKHQKQEILIELKNLLSDAIPHEVAQEEQRKKAEDERNRRREEEERGGNEKRRHRSRSRSKERERRTRRSRSRDRRRSRSRDRRNDQKGSSFKDRPSNRNEKKIGGKSNRPGEEKADGNMRVANYEYKDQRIQIGNLSIRTMTPDEIKALEEDDVVVAQDMKTGKWNTARVLKMMKDRVLLSVGESTWKKKYSEIYREVTGQEEEEERAGQRDVLMAGGNTQLFSQQGMNMGMLPVQMRQSTSNQYSYSSAGGTSSAAASGYLPQGPPPFGLSTSSGPIRYPGMGGY